MPTELWNNRGLLLKRSLKAFFNDLSVFCTVIIAQDWLCTLSQTLQWQSIANCMTLVRIVMAPTAISPPYFSRERVETYRDDTLTSLHDKCGKPESDTRKNNLRFQDEILFPDVQDRLFSAKEKKRTQMQETACDRIVASAAPLTPRWNAKINSGSRTMFITAPIRTESIPVLAKPCVVINIFMPRVSWTKIVPTA